MDFPEDNTLVDEQRGEEERKKRARRSYLMLIPCLILAFFLIGLGAYLYFSFTLPPIKSLEDYKPPIITKVLSDEGELVGEFCKERRIVVPMQQIPKVLSQAFVAAEDALLVGLPQSPENYSPLKNFDRSKARQAYVLGRMVEEGYITRQAADAAYRVPLKIQARENSSLNIAPYFTEYVRIYLQEKYGEEALYTQGLQIHTTLNVVNQKAAQEAMQAGLTELDRRQGYRGPEQVLKNEEIDAFCQEVARKLTGKPLTVGETYMGVVTEITKDNKRVIVRIGDKTGYIPFEQMRWARSPDPEVDYTTAQLLPLLFRQKFWRDVTTISLAITGTSVVPN